ncbi:hypothetical protein ACFRFH_06070 [Leifsonia sp. NPDC056824]|uniref:hypothetical protein n=1 Tax=Leifsonia sp. NPDC056824 TaxID=3345953 RepID=UPI003687C2E9
MTNRGWAIATWLLVLVATAASAVVTCWWYAVDGAIIERADLRGWNGEEMLPAQELIWVAVNVQFLVLIAASILTTIGMILSVRSRDHTRRASAPANASSAFSAAGTAPRAGSRR